MSIWTSLFTGSSGLEAHGNAIGVVGDNIANVSTVGFKSSRAGFEDLLGGTAPNGQRFGVGTRMDGAQSVMGQGSFLQTGDNSDMGIRGQGFFVLKGVNQGGIPGQFYSRDGRFDLDKEGMLRNNDGLAVQGYLINTKGQMSSELTNLPIGGISTPQPTTIAGMQLNLDSSAAPPAAWDPLNPGATSNYSTSMTMYDSLGAAHKVDAYFRASGNGNWEWHTMVDGGELQGGTPGTPTEIGNGTLSFTNTGALQSAVTNASSANFKGAAPGQNITMDFGDPIANGGTGLAGSTQFAEASSVKGTNQDGWAAGTLSEYAVNEDGVITGIFSNGQSRPVARLALALFRSETGLTRAGAQLFQQSPDSGEPLVAVAGDNGRGGIISGSLEGSNVDIGSELVTLIAYQRAFQANARTVSTADEMLQEVANLKR